MKARTPSLSRRLLVSVTTSACLLLHFVQAQAQDYTAQVKKQVALVKAAGEQGGWQVTHSTKYHEMPKGRSNSFSLNLEKGWAYKIIAVCDNDCSDLDLVLYDENNNEISKDLGNDSLPMVEVTPRWTGRFSLRVTMYSCSNSPCFYGITVLGK